MSNRVLCCRHSRQSTTLRLRQKRPIAWCWSAIVQTPRCATAELRLLGAACCNKAHKNLCCRYCEHTHISCKTSSVILGRLRGDWNSQPIAFRAKLKRSAATWDKTQDVLCCRYLEQADKQEIVSFSCLLVPASACPAFDREPLTRHMPASGASGHRQVGQH